jgi:taurine dioxygenase
MTYRLIRVEPVSPHVGAEISGVDPVRPITADAFTEIRRAFGQYGVVFFRDQDLTPEQHVAFAERFAPIDINRFFTAVPGYPIIAEVRKEPEQTRNIGGRRPWSGQSR